MATQALCPFCQQPRDPADSTACRSCGRAFVADGSDSTPSAVGLMDTVQLIRQTGTSGVVARKAAASGEEKERPLSLEGVALAWIDRLLPRRKKPFLIMIALIAGGSWLIGYLLAPNRAAFLTAHEWRIQPFFLAVHFVCLRLFATCYARNFLAGAAHVLIPEGLAIRRMRQLLGPAGFGVAVLIAVPLAVENIFYLYSDAYRAIAPYAAETLGAVDWFLWLIWCVEWVVNAYIWVLLVGFFALTMRTLRTYPFRAPVEVLLHEKHYRPFLQMSAQGSSIVLFFGMVYCFYVWYTSGDITDYIALVVTGVLLLLGFVPPWFQLKASVQRMVDAETGRLHQRLSRTLRRYEMPREEREISLRSLADQLSDTLAMLHVGYLERLHRDLGRAEASAILLRLLAPASALVWQLVRRFIMPAVMGM